MKKLLRHIIFVPALALVFVPFVPVSVSAAMSKAELDRVTPAMNRLLISLGNTARMLKGDMERDEARVNELSAKVTTVSASLSKVAVLPLTSEANRQKLALSLTNASNTLVTIVGELKTIEIRRTRLLELLPPINVDLQTIFTSFARLLSA